MVNTAPSTSDEDVITGPLSGWRQRRQSTLNSLASPTISAAHIASITILSQDLPLGFFAASAEAASSAPSISEVRRRGGSSIVDQCLSSSSRHDTAAEELQRGPLLSDQKCGVICGPLTEEPLSFDEHDEPATPTEIHVVHAVQASDQSLEVGKRRPLTYGSNAAIAQYFHAPPHATSLATQSIGDNSNQQRKGSASWWTVTTHCLKIFWLWFCTPFGFLLAIYGLNIIAWGGMLFLLLCNAAPAMCSRNAAENDFDGCNDINSPRRIWIETDSQILNALFCVTGLGLFPWRARDLYYLLRFRLASRRRSIQERVYGLRVLAAIHRGWFRLPGHDTLSHTSTSEYLQGLGDASAHEASDDFRIPLHCHPVRQSAPSTTEAMGISTTASSTLTVTLSPLPTPLTGIYAAPTETWKLDFFVYCQMGNTAFQCCLCGFMWGMSRHNRPSWATGLFVALACGISCIGGAVSWWEGRRVKKVEGEAPRESQGVKNKGAIKELDLELQQTKTNHEIVLVGGKRPHG